MTTHTDPITNAVRLLTAAASSEHLAAAQALQDFAESLGAGGMQPLVSRRNVTGTSTDPAQAAINSGAEAIPTDSTGCTAGTDQECANRACATHCPALAPQQAAQEPFRPDWMNYKTGFASGMAEAREQVEPLIRKMLELLQAMREAATAHADGYVWGDYDKTIDAARAWLESAEPQQAAPDKSFWPVDPRSSRKQLIHQIGQMNFRLTALRGEVEGLRKKNECLRKEWKAVRPAPQTPAPGLVPLTDVLARVDACAGPGSAVRLALEREFGQPAA